MVRTRVGYTGGDEDSPTYRDLGDHSEAIQVDFDPEVVSYGELIEVFWESHNPCARPWSTQYKSAVFVHDEEQRRLAEETAAEIAAERGQPVRTEILPAGSSRVPRTTTRSTGCERTAGSPPSSWRTTRIPTASHGLDRRGRR